MMVKHTDEVMAIIHQCNVRNYIELNYSWLKTLKRSRYPKHFRPKSENMMVFRKTLDKGLDWGIIVKFGGGSHTVYELSTKGERLVVEYERKGKDNGSIDEEEP